MSIVVAFLCHIAVRNLVYVDQSQSSYRSWSIFTVSHFEFKSKLGKDFLSGQVHLIHISSPFQHSSFPLPGKSVIPIWNQLMVVIRLSLAYSCRHGYWQKLSWRFNKKTKHKEGQRGEPPELPEGSLRRPFGGPDLSAGIGNASAFVIRLKLLLTSSYVEMWLIT